MMKRYKPVLILLSILILLCGIYFLISRIKSGGLAADHIGSDHTGGQGDSEMIGRSDAPTELSLVSIPIQELSELNVKVNSEVFSLVRVDLTANDSQTDTDTWKIGNRNDFSASAESLQIIVQNFCSLTANKIVEENALDLSIYGFSNETSAKVEGLLVNGAMTSIEIGNQNMTKDGYYVRKGEDNTVYLCDNYVGERLKIERSAIMDLTLFQYGNAGLQWISMERDGEKVFTAVRVDDVTWDVTEPIRFAMSTEAYEMIPFSIKELRAQNCVAADATDLKEYGLDFPRYRLSVKGDTAEHVLLLGAEKDRGVSVYAMLEGRQPIYTISLSKLPFLDKPIREIVDPFAFIVNIAEVEQLSAVFDGQNILCDFTDRTEDQHLMQSAEQKQEIFIVNGVNLMALDDSLKAVPAFRSFYQGIIGIQLYAVEPEANPSGEPEITFSYKLKVEPFNMKVEFISKDDRLFYLFRNGEYTGAVVEKRQLDKAGGLRQTWKALADIIGSPSEG